MHPEIEARTLNESGVRKIGDRTVEDRTVEGCYLPTIGSRIYPLSTDAMHN